LASELAKLTHQSTEMKKQSNEIKAWRVNFDTDQEQRFCKQDKKMAKKLVAQSEKFDDKMEGLANSIQQQLTTHQSSTKQMMTAQHEQIDALLKELAVALNNITGNITANSKAISSIIDKLNNFNDGPHNKRQNMAMRPLRTRMSWKMRMLSG